MPKKKISQADAWGLFHEARLLKEELQKQRMDWRNDFPGGVHLGSFDCSVIENERVRIARRLGHAVVVTNINTNVLEFYALPLPKVGA